VAVENNIKSYHFDHCISRSQTKEQMLTEIAGLIRADNRNRALNSLPSCAS